MTVVSPQNVKRIPNKPKTVDSVNVVNVKKAAIVVKGKQPGGQAAAQNNSPLTLQVDMINRNSALTPSVYQEGENQMNTSTVLSEENATGVPPRPSRRQHQSNDDRANHQAP